MNMWQTAPVFAISAKGDPGFSHASGGAARILSLATGCARAALCSVGIPAIGIVGLVIWFLLGIVPASAETVGLRAGEHDGFTRLVIQTASPGGWQLGRRGSGYALVLDRADLALDLTEAFSRIQRTRIGDLRFDPATRQLSITLACLCHAAAFDLQGTAIVVDIRDGSPPPGADFERPLITAASARGGPDDGFASASGEVAGAAADRTGAAMVGGRSGYPSDPEAVQGAAVGRDPASMPEPEPEPETGPEPGPEPESGPDADAGSPFSQPVAQQPDPRVPLYWRNQPSASARDPSPGRPKESVSVAEVRPPPSGEPDGAEGAEGHDIVLAGTAPVMSVADSDAARAYLVGQLARAAAQGVVDPGEGPAASAQANPGPRARQAQSDDAMHQLARPSGTAEHGAASATAQGVDAEADPDPAQGPEHGAGSGTGHAAEPDAGEPSDVVLAGMPPDVGHAGAQPGDPSAGVAGHLQLHAETVIDRDGLAAVAVRPETGPPQVVCLPDAAVDIAGWGRDTDVAAQIGAANRALLGEFDRPDPDAVLDLTRLYLHLGWGAEARATLHVFGGNEPERATLRAIAGLVDGDVGGDGDGDGGGDGGGDGNLAGMQGCPGDVAMWAMLASAGMAPPDIPAADMEPGKASEHPSAARAAAKGPASGGARALATASLPMDADLGAAVAVLQDGDPSESHAASFGGVAAGDGAPHAAPAAGDGTPLSGPASETRVRAVVRAFSRLPLHLRRQIGPLLADRFLDEGDIETARVLRSAVTRAGGDPGDAMHLIDAELAARDGDLAGASAQLGRIIAENGPSAADALIRLIDLAVAAGIPVPEPTLRAAEAMAFEQRGSVLGRRLSLAALAGVASNGQLDAAFTQWAALGDPPMTAADLAALELPFARGLAAADDATFLRMALAEADRMSALPFPPERRLAFADRLVALGFPDAARRLAGPLLDAPTLPAARLTSARLSLAAGDYASVAGLLAGRSDPASLALLAQASLGAGKPATAAGQFAAAGEPEAEAETAWRAGDWALVSAVGSPVRRTAAALLVSPDPEGPGAVNASAGSTASEAGVATGAAPDPAARGNPASASAGPVSNGPGLAATGSDEPDPAALEADGPQSVQPEPVGRRPGGPESNGPQSDGAQSGGPQSGGPQSGGPESDGPQSGGAQSGGPQSGGPEPLGTDLAAQGSATPDARRREVPSAAPTARQDPETARIAAVSPPGADSAGVGLPGPGGGVATTDTATGATAITLARATALLAESAAARAALDALLAETALSPEGP